MVGLPRQLRRRPPTTTAVRHGGFILPPQPADLVEPQALGCVDQKSRRVKNRYSYRTGIHTLLFALLLDLLSQVGGAIIQFKRRNCLVGRLTILCPSNP
jgi:hypothetical protein